MRILYIAHHFPPANNVGSVRSGKLVKYLIRSGHEVRVISVANTASPKTLPVEIPDALVTRTNWMDRRKSFSILGKLAPSQAFGDKAPLDAAPASSPVRKLKRLYRSLLYFPDREAGWLVPLLQSGRAIIEGWRPDVIYATASPVTSLVAASMLSRSSGVPWVAELRDLWSDNHNYQFGKLRHAIDSWLERRTLSSAAAIVTVSRPLAETLTSKYSVPVRVVTNGFDPEDYPPTTHEPNPSELTLSFTGSFYPASQDLGLLLRAIQSLGEAARALRVQFFGATAGSIKQLLQQYPSAARIEVSGSIPYEESLRVQQAADCLLFFCWNDYSQPGIFTGKLFEYIGAGRPILAIGNDDNVAAQLIRDRDFGKVFGEVDKLATHLRERIEHKRRFGTIQPPPGRGREEFTRERQAEEVVQYLELVLQNRRSMQCPTSSSRTPST